jgi:hypothetical protein
MTTETKLRGGLVLTILVLLWFTLMWSNGIVTIEEQKNTIDSLNVSLDSPSLDCIPLYIANPAISKCPMQISAFVLVISSKDD